MAWKTQQQESEAAGDILSVMRTHKEKSYGALLTSLFIHFRVPSYVVVLPTYIVHLSTSVNQSKNSLTYILVSWRILDPAMLAIDVHHPIREIDSNLL